MFFCGKKGKKLFTCLPKWHLSHDNDPYGAADFVDTHNERKEKGPFTMGANVQRYKNIL
jgi:hypothetical protein